MDTLTISKPNTSVRTLESTHAPVRSIRFSDQNIPIFFQPSEFAVVFAATDYLLRLIRLLNLPVSVTTVPNAQHENWFAKYESTWQRYPSQIPGRRYGRVIINMHKNLSRKPEDVFMTMRHELAHAICDICYKVPLGHCNAWIRVAKLLRVNTTPYENIDVIFY